ncbi:glycosyltransferase family 4 protein [Nocardia sp. NPDC052566]|uniref:glycosyltransferase family 4 protein n=1 Tax=Nocardia sp. NPDC052566 TaxID=3364330 RepID=UPI0037C96DFD
MTQDQSPTAVLDQFGFPARWSVHTRREIRRVARVLDALSPVDRIRLAEGRHAADVLVGDPADPASATAAPITNRRLVLVLPFPVQTGGMRVQLELAKMLRDQGAEVHVRQVRGDDCLDEKYDRYGFASRAPLSDPRALAGALRELAPATLLVGCWIDYFAALESGAGPVIGYSAGEPTLRRDPDGFDRDFIDFAFRMHQLPVTLWAGSQSMVNIFRQRFHRAAALISVPIASAMFDQDRTPAPQPPFRVIVVGPEHVTSKGIPAALQALSPLRHEGVHLVWVSPGPPSEQLACLVDELRVGLNATEVAATIGSCHALVFPSRVEGLGNPPLEAMALGVPSVLCPNGGSAEYALPERNCLQVPYADAESLRAAVRRLRDDPALAARLRTAGFDTAERYRPENIHRIVGEFMAAKFEQLPFVPLDGAD